MRGRPPRAVTRTIATEAELATAVYGFRPSRIVLSAAQLGLFTLLGAEKLAAAELAARAGVDARAGERLFNALCALGLMKKARGRFRNAGIARECLVEGGPRYMANLAHAAGQWQNWSTLSEAVRRGTAVRRRPAARGDEPRRRGFIAAMHARARLQAPRVVELLDLSGVGRCLDIGAGSGAYAMALVRARDGLRATAYDLPAILPLTREYVRREGLQGRIDFLAGDFRRGGFGSGYDLVLLSAIVHMNDEAQNRRLVARAAAALNRGGQLVIQDFIMSPDRTRPAAGALFALNMLVSTARGDSYTAGEIGSWMRAAGLKRIRKIGTPFDASLLVGRKA
jgi:SAM-dependent methyltransferase